MLLFFALDHYNYCWWASVHLQDMKSLFGVAKNTLEDEWVVQKQVTDFPVSPLTSVMSWKMPKLWEVVGSSDWMKIHLHLNSGISVVQMRPEYNWLRSDLNERWYRFCQTPQRRVIFQKEARNLFETIDTFGNPFAEISTELMNLHSHDYAEDTVIKSVRSLESLGQEQYVKYKEDVFQKPTRKINDTLKKNNLPLYNTPKRKKSTKAMHLKGIHNDILLFGRLYIANQQREGDPAVFFWT